MDRPQQDTPIPTGAKFERWQFAVLESIRLHLERQAARPLPPKPDAATQRKER